MEKINPIEAYPELFHALSSLQEIPVPACFDFITRSKVVEFKKNEVVHAEGDDSTHAYFIVSGIMMCYVRNGDEKMVKWLRGRGDYAYSMDMTKDFSEFKFSAADNILLALEDIVAIKISHDDLKWLEENSIEFKKILFTHLTHYNQVAIARQAFPMMDPENKYQFMQRHMTLDLGRVPDIYLSSFLDISLKEVEAARKAFGN